MQGGSDGGGAGVFGTPAAGLLSPPGVSPGIVPRSVSGSAFGFEQIVESPVCRSAVGVCSPRRPRALRGRCGSAPRAGRPEIT